MRALTIRRTFIGAAVVAFSTGGMLAATVSSSSAGANPSQVFTFTGAAQTFVVPDGICELDVNAVGASGGAGGDFGDFSRPANSTYGDNAGDVSAEQAPGPPGLGGETQSTITVTPGETLTIMVGGAGADDIFSTIGGNGGFNGGGHGGAGEGVGGGGGGGASDVRRGGSGLSNRVVIAAGGGGGGAGGPGGDGAEGGDGGGTTGADGEDGAGTFPDEQGGGGGGGTQVSGGAAGSNALDFDFPFFLFAGPGTLGKGGRGGTSGDGGGGGGGGFYGGGGGGSGFGGSGGGGGGGSGFGPAGSVFAPGVNDGNGVVGLSWNPADQPADCGAAAPTIVVTFTG